MDRKFNLIVWLMILGLIGIVITYWYVLLMFVIIFFVIKYLIKFAAEEPKVNLFETDWKQNEYLVQPMIGESEECSVQPMSVEPEEKNDDREKVVNEVSQERTPPEFKYEFLGEDFDKLVHAIEKKHSDFKKQKVEFGFDHIYQYFTKGDQKILIYYDEYYDYVGVESNIEIIGAEELGLVRCTETLCIEGEPNAEE